MAFCQNCGRRLADNEVCNCTAGAQQNTQVPPPPANPNQTFIDPNIQQPQKQKGSLWWIWLIIIPLVLIVFLIVAVLAAIFVPAMVGYTKKSKFASANANSNSLYKAANSALVELDEEGTDLKGYYIISSNSDNNYNVPDNFKVDDFEEKVENYFSDISNLEWFVVVENGTATYAATSESWNAELTGSYPAGYNLTPKYYGDTSYYSTSSTTEKRSLTKLYNDAGPKVKEKAEEYLKYEEDSYDYGYYF